MIRPPRTNWSVEWFVGPEGFEVYVRNGEGAIVDHAARGNHRGNDLDTVESDDPNVLPLWALTEEAAEAARQLAEEYRVPTHRVSEVQVQCCT